MVQLTYLSNFTKKFNFVFYFVIQPVLMPVWFQVRLILKNARYFRTKSFLLYFVL
uniref:Uncharacterized protein n=1 Tax=Candidatus Kentrum eta TaxID=2126337 RepID=A0A450VQ83_9GAMM|nr:MAG: hypothetical protein BECKH772B_GA0070898_107292 [Candidatus Kentron sp. H]VFK07509.1 MAG: hypothetical protein BECKH772A_GA0070896_107422 [Candidatus Kentron sp. H]VFK08584.1 MAG: hypothetical protein BECKH772C_GA0070978_105261 [Candidatus Kentron sp. H]VFK09761.1 MAG: hypothetical protein BECKH772C_GA0070978_106381 [Candidatus Kentron sp. H]VFK10524.1 MAG: hypothetical protein BECKH772C_GA0070978_107162 [Candidatus Kentron sp. H]